MIVKTLRNNTAMFNESIKMSWDHIRGNKMRSFLTTLGIIIGIASVIALITIVSGIIDKLSESFDSMGAGTIEVMAQPSPVKNGFNQKDIDKILAIDNVSGVMTQIDGVGSAVVNGKVAKVVDIRGKNDRFFQENRKNLISGRGLSKMDMGRNSYVCEVDEDIVKNMFKGEDPVDKEITLQGHTYTIVGVWSKNQDNNYWNQTKDSKGKIYIPYENAMKILKIDSIDYLNIYTKDSTKAKITQEKIRAVLDEAYNYKKNAYMIVSMDKFLKEVAKIKAMMTAMLAGIASISLLVGGIGIMNMMLVSVSERTKEIGLRKALGAEPEQIQLQFVIEAIFLSVMGGIVGIVVGLLIAFVASILIGNDFRIIYYSIALGVGFAMVVGIGFGWGPSKKASKLNPIDALRSE